MLFLKEVFYNDQSMDNSTDQPQSPNQKKGLDIVNLGELIKKHLSDIERLKAQIREQKTMSDDAFSQDATYHENDQKVKDLTKVRTAVKQKILKTPALEAITVKIKGYKDELKDAQSALSGYLQEYYRVSGSRSIENNQGELLEIVPVFKLVKRKE